MSIAIAPATLTRSFKPVVRAKSGGNSEMGACDDADRKHSNGIRVAPTPNQRLRILIADHHEVVRAGLRSIVDTRADWQIVAEASDGKEAISKVIASRPDIAVVDYSLPVINGVEATRQIKQRSSSTEVLAFTVHDNDAVIAELLQAGARACVLKSDNVKHLVAAIESLAIHKPFFSQRISESLLHTFLETRRPSHDSVISPRERVVIQLIAEGHSNKTMSQILNLSIKTIETHRASAMHKLNISSTAGLVRYAVRNKIVEP